MVCGFYYVEEKRAKIKDYVSEYEEKEEKENKEAPILIYNHVSYADIVYLIASQFGPSFISKIDVKGYPVFGSVCTALQSIYVQRDAKDDRNSVLELMKERYY